MKKAKIKDGFVKYVWPNSKGKDMPPMHPKVLAQFVQDVPDYVQAGMWWNGKAFVWRPKIAAPAPRNYFMEVLCANRDWTYEQCKEEARRLKTEEWDAYKAAWKAAFEEPDEASMTKEYNERLAAKGLPVEEKATDEAVVDATEELEVAATPTKSTDEPSI